MNLFRAARGALIVICCGTTAIAQSEAPPRQAAPASIPEDVDVSGVVNVLDSETFTQLFGDGDLAADVTRDGVLDIRDIVAMEAAVAEMRRERLLVPEIPQYEPADLIRARGVTLYVYRHVENASFGYLLVPFDGAASRPGADNVTVTTPTGASGTLIFAEGRLISAAYDIGSGPALMTRIQVEDPEFELGIERLLLADPLPPIGNCPTCVPLRVPAEGCVYLYSKWGFNNNCLTDFYGCTDADGDGSIEPGTACCKSPSPGSSVPKCPGSGVSTP